MTDKSDLPRPVEAESVVIYRPDGLPAEPSKPKQIAGFDMRSQSEASGVRISKRKGTHMGETKKHESKETKQTKMKEGKHGKKGCA
jgi:hypothetical protein